MHRTRSAPRLLVEGVELLDAAMERPFVDLPDERKVEALKEIEGSDFFNEVRGATVRVSSTAIPRSGPDSATRGPRPTSAAT